MRVVGGPHVFLAAAKRNGLSPSAHGIERQAAVDAFADVVGLDEVAARHLSFVCGAFDPIPEGVFTLPLISGVLGVEGEAVGALLVIEDHPQLAKSLCRLAATCGLAASVVTSAAQARTRIREDWSGVIADVALPDGNALDVLESERTASPILILTALDSRNVIERAFDLRANYLRKPIDPERIHGWLLDISTPDARLSRALETWRTRFALSTTELEVLRLTAACRKTQREIACHMHVSVETVRSHAKSLLRKTKDRTLAFAALRFLETLSKIA